MTETHSSSRPAADSGHTSRLNQDELYLRLVDSSLIPIAVHDADKLLYANNAFAKLLGVNNSADLIGHSLLEYVHQDGKESAELRLKNVLEQQQEAQLITQRLKNKAGKIIAVDVAGIPITYLDQSAVHLIIYDTIEQFRVEQALRESQERLQMIVESTDDGIFIKDLEGYYMMTNPAWARCLGGSVADVLGKKDADLFPEDRIKFLRETDQQVLTSGQSYTYELTVPAEGAECTLMVTKFPFRSRQKAIVGVAAVARDITERLRMEQAERQQRIFAEALSDIARTINTTLDLEEVLDRILAQLGQVVPHDAAHIMLVEKDVLCMACHNGYTDRDLDDVMDSLQIATEHLPDRQRQLIDGEALIVPDTSKGDYWRYLAGMRWVKSFASVPICVGGKIIGFLNLVSETRGHFNDSYARRLEALADQAATAIHNARLYEAISSHAAELEARNDALDAFSYTVAHDLKSPLHVIMGFANVLREQFRDEMSDDVAQYLGHIEDYAERMNDLIKSLLILARIRSADEAITVVDTGPIVKQVLEQFSGPVSEQGISVDVQADLPSVMGHGPWIERVFANLLDNAVKYIGRDNPSPKIAVRAARQDGKVRFEVEDNGIGIKPEYQSTLFDVFTRIESGYKVDGTGIGLSIVYRIITKLNGQVGVDSKPGKGSTFWFTLPGP